MSVLKSWDIDLLASEKKTLLNFLGLYSFFAVIIIAIISFMYFNFQKDLMLQQKRATLQEYANSLILNLKDLHINFDKYQTYPRFKEFETAIYDSDKVKIFSTFKNQDVDFNKLLYISGDNIHFISRPESYYLGSKYIIVTIPVESSWLYNTYENITVFALTALLFMVIFGYFLLRLLLKPMKNALLLLDRFIKDTTHELNTPVSAILTNIEMINKNSVNDKTLKKINRIDTASKTISNIYQDLTYLTLNKKIMSKDEVLNLKPLINERVEYFKTLIQSKNIKIRLELNDAYLTIDKFKITKVIDNLLSNAIKYNKINGQIQIILTQNSLQINDSGIGIDKKRVKEIFKRYKRFDESVGGFGIGLSIVNMIAKEYNLQIDIDSQLKIGTKVKISW